MVLIFLLKAKKSLTKRTVIGQTDGKNNKLTNTTAENFQLINAAGLIDDKAIVNIEKVCPFKFFLMSD